MGNTQTTGSEAAPQAQAEAAMVSTRRSSRLQAPSSLTTEVKEATASSSPARGSKRSPRKQQQQQQQQEEKKTTEEEEEKTADESAEDIPVDDDSAEEAAGLDVVVSDAVEHTEQPKEAAKEQEEEEEVLLLDDDDEEEEDVVELPADDDAETETDEDAAARGGEEDVAGYALLAASGLDLFGTGSSSTITKPTTSTRKRSTAAVRRSLVPDQLDSGAGQHATFLELKGRRHAEGATLLQAARSKEEQVVVTAGLEAVARSHAQRAESRKKTAGGKWFDMASEELTADARRDFALLRMRTYLDPKKFYKSSDHHKGLPKHFQSGVVIEGAHEFKSARMTKKERRQTFTDEIMADNSVRQYTKRVFSQVQAAKSGRGKKKAKKTHRAF